MLTIKKEVKQALRDHISEYYDNIEALKDDIKALDYMDNIYKQAYHMVEGGNFLVYYDDVQKFLSNIIKTDKNYSDNEAWDLYKHLIAREITALIKL